MDSRITESPVTEAVFTDSRVTEAGVMGPPVTEGGANRDMRDKDKTRNGDGAGENGKQGYNRGPQLSVPFGSRFSAGSDDISSISIGIPS